MRDCTGTSGATPKSTKFPGKISGQIMYHAAAAEIIDIRFHTNSTDPAVLNDRFKEGNTIEITLSGPGYEKCTKTCTIPAKKTYLNSKYHI